MIIKIPIRLRGGGNTREHKMSRHRRVKSERQVVEMQLHDWGHRRSLAKEKAENPDGRWVITLTRIAPRKMDRGDNLPALFKGVRDEIARQLEISDGDERHEWKYAQERGEVREYAIGILIQSRAEWDRPPPTLLDVVHQLSNSNPMLGHLAPVHRPSLPTVAWRRFAGAPKEEKAKPRLRLYSVKGGAK